MTYEEHLASGGAPRASALALDPVPNRTSAAVSSLRTSQAGPSAAASFRDDAARASGGASGRLTQVRSRLQGSPKVQRIRWKRSDHATGAAARDMLPSCLPFTHRASRMGSGRRCRPKKTLPGKRTGKTSRSKAPPSRRDPENKKKPFYATVGPHSCSGRLPNLFGRPAVNLDHHPERFTPLPLVPRPFAFCTTLRSTFLSHCYLKNPPNGIAV